MTPEEIIKRSREIEASADAGPWRAEESLSGNALQIWAIRSGDNDKSVASMSSFGTASTRANNAAALSLARNVFPALLDILECALPEAGGDPCIFCGGVENEHASHCCVGRALAALEEGL